MTFWRGMDSFLVNVSQQVSMTKVALSAYAEMEAAPKLEGYARANAPWHDISGAARAGLKGGSYIKGQKIIIYIAHSVDYGVYLELAHDKKYEILDPTIEKNKGRIWSDYKKIMGMKL